MAEAHLLAEPFIVCELIRCTNRTMGRCFARWLKVLAKRKDVRALGDEITYRREDLIGAFSPRPSIMPVLVGTAGAIFLRAAQHLE